MTKEEKIKAIAEIKNNQKQVLEKILIASNIEEIISLVFQLKFLEVEKYKVAAIPNPNFAKGSKDHDGFAIVGTESKEEVIINKK